MHSPPARPRDPRPPARRSQTAITPSLLCAFALGLPLAAWPASPRDATAPFIPAPPAARAQAATDAPPARPTPAAPVTAAVLLAQADGGSSGLTPRQAQAQAQAPVTTVAAVSPAPRFDLSVANAPAAQVYMQLASGTAFNVLVSPEVTGSISVTLKDTTLPEALDTLRELFGYDFRITGNRVFIYSNAVQTRLYRVNYLPGRREGSSDVRVTASSMNGSGGSVGATGGAGTGNGGAQGGRNDDSANVRTTSDSDFWREVQASLASLVGSVGGRGVVLNPAAGVVVVKATPNEQRQVEQYLKAVQLSIERQVMLEAKIVEVSLSKDSQSGINWAAFGRILGDRIGVSAGVVQPGTQLRNQGPISSSDVAANVASDLVASSLGRGFYGVALQATNFAALLNFLQTQGDVSVLSSPRVATLNNQKAVLKVGNDELFVTGVSTTTSNSGGSNNNNAVTTPSLTLQPFFSGIALDVTPQIDDAGNVILHVHPSISVVTEKNKVIDLGALGQYRLPLASSAISQTDSIVRVRDGQIVAIGGLMTQETRTERSGVPGLQDMPGVGGLFRQNGQVSSKRELVILMKPTIIRDEAPWPAQAEPVGAPKS